DLAAGGAREIGHQLEPLRQLAPREPARREERADLAERRWLRLRAAADDGTGDLARSGVGDADHRHLRDRGGCGEQVLHLPRADVLTLSDDDVLLPAGDAEIALGVERPEIARPEPAVGGERLRVERAALVAEEALRPAGEDLALAARRHGSIGIVDDA